MFSAHVSVSHTILQAEIAAAVAEAETERLRIAERDARRAERAAAAVSAAPQSASQARNAGAANPSAGALAKLKQQEKDAVDRSVGESFGVICNVWNVCFSVALKFG
jgi:hypothetical protein